LAKNVTMLIVSELIVIARKIAELPIAVALA